MAEGACQPQEKGLTRLNVTLRHLTTDDAKTDSKKDNQKEVLSPESTDGDDSVSSSIPAIDLEGAKYGAISALRTGNPAKDMITAMLVPLLFKSVFDGVGFVPKLVDKIMAYFEPPTPLTFERTLKIKQIRDAWGDLVRDDESKGSVLLRAITLFISQKQLNYKRADMDLVPLKQNLNSYCYYYESSDDDDDDDEDKDSRTEAGRLRKKYRLTRSAPEDKWVEVEPGIQYKKTVESQGEGDEKSKLDTKIVTVTLTANTEEAVDDFINRAYDYYLDELRKMQDDSRYMYELVSMSKKGDDGTEPRKYRRYKLSDEKTFLSLFFPEKDNLLKLLDDFQNRSGKYAIPGYPHKLGLLLHGPPGTGKTSMIKALAHHTGRNIVNVPLARINTNAELMEVMFDPQYHVVGQESPKRLRFKDIIFVMEDVDAVSKIVHRRDGKDGKSEDGIDKGSGLVLAKDSKESSKEESAKDSKDSSKEESAESKKKEEGKEEEKKDNAEAKKEETPSGDNSGDGEKKKDAAAELLGSLLGPAADPSKKSSGTADSGAGSDRLNLSGILNALDGVVDSPNRMLVMTTNHPEKLDSALIRPGRIDKKFLLGYMAGPQCVLMVQHYFQRKLAEAEGERICSIIDGAKGQHALEITPARLEQLCAEHDVIDSLLEALVKLRDEFNPTKVEEVRKKIVLKRANSVNVEVALNRSQTVPVPTKGIELIRS